MGVCSISNSIVGAQHFIQYRYISGNIQRYEPAAEFLNARQSFQIIQVMPAHGGQDDAAGPSIAVIFAGSCLQTATRSATVGAAIISPVLR